MHLQARSDGASLKLDRIGQERVRRVGVGKPGMAEATIAQANAASTSTIERRKRAREVKSLQRVGEAPGAIRKK